MDKAKTLTQSSLFERSAEPLGSQVSGDGCSMDEPCTVEPKALNVDLPFIGVVNLREYSLPILAIVLGFID